MTIARTNAIADASARHLLDAAKEAARWLRADNQDAPTYIGATFADALGAINAELAEPVTVAEINLIVCPTFSTLTNALAGAPQAGTLQ